MKRKQWLALALALAMLVLCLAGCSQDTSTDTGSTDSDTSTDTNTDTNTETDTAEAKNITVILKNSTAPFFISVAEGAEAAGADLGYNVTVKTPVDTAEGSGNEQQSQLADEAIVAGADLIVMCPVDSEAIIPVCERIVEAGIPIVNLNTRINDETLYETFAGLENVNQGYNIAKVLFDGMGGEGDLFIIEGSTGAQTSIDRVIGCEKALEEYPDINVVAQQSANYSRAEAMNVVQNLLQTYPDVDAIYCCNDEMALGAAEAVDAAGKTGEILICGQDANDDAVAALKEGKIYCTSYGNPYMQGYTSIEAARDVLEGNEVKDFYEVTTLPVTIDNADTFEEEAAAQ